MREIVDAGLPDNNVHSLFQDEEGGFGFYADGIASSKMARFIPVKGVPGGQGHSLRRG